MDVTIDELIAKLKEAQEIIGANGRVEFWGDDAFIDWQFTDSFNGPVKEDIAGDKKCVRFRIEKKY